jgi:hypothetical protein
MEKYLYFRTQATLGDDDASSDSCMFPLSRMTGMVPSADDTLNIYFSPMIPFQHDDQNGNVINSDYVVVTLSAVNTHADVIAALSKKFADTFRDDGYLSVADDYLGTFAVDGIAGLSTISVAAAVS